LLFSYKSIQKLFNFSFLPTNKKGGGLNKKYQLFFLIKQITHFQWQTAIDDAIPLFLNNYGPYRDFLVSIENLMDTTSHYVLKLPNIPKSFKEMIIVRCWLEHLFNCAFECAYFDKGVFNPEMINILFENNKQIPLKFNIEEACLWANDDTFHLQFYFEHLSISKSFSINLESVDITEEDLEILFFMSVNEGDKFPQIYFCNSELIRVYDFILDVS